MESAVWSSRASTRQVDPGGHSKHGDPTNTANIHATASNAEQSNSTESASAELAESIAAELNNEVKNEESHDEIFDVDLNTEEMFAKIFNKNGNKDTKVSYVPKKGLQVKYDLFGNPIFANAPVRRAPPLNTLTKESLEEVDKNDDLYKLIYKDVGSDPSICRR